MDIKRISIIRLISDIHQYLDVHEIPNLRFIFIVRSPLLQPIIAKWLAGLQNSVHWGYIQRHIRPHELTSITVHRSTAMVDAPESYCT